MKKKIIGMFIITLIMTSFLGSIVTAKTNVVSEEVNIKNISEQRLDAIVESNNETEITTGGSLSTILYIAEINLIDGPFFKIWLIERILNSRNTRFLLPLILVEVEDLAFSIKYNKNIPQLPLLKRFSYETVVKDNGNETSFTEKHTVIVTGFKGKFGFSRLKPLRLTPASFWFTGTCEEVTVLT